MHQAWQTPCSLKLFSHNEDNISRQKSSAEQLVANQKMYMSSTKIAQNKAQIS
jgi:hypothetical protein